MDLTESIAPRSDQVNTDDMIGGPATVTIETVVAGSAEQPVDIRLVEFPGRAYRPSKSMRRVLVAAWGADSTVYVGRRLTIYRDPEVTFGRDKVGGLKISHLSHIDKRLSIALTVTRGKRAMHTINPLPDAAPSSPTPEPPAETVAECTDIDALKAMWQASGPERRAQIEARVAELRGES